MKKLFIFPFVVIVLTVNCLGKDHPQKALEVIANTLGVDIKSQNLGKTVKASPVEYLDQSLILFQASEEEIPCTNEHLEIDSYFYSTILKDTNDETSLNFQGGNYMLINGQKIKINPHHFRDEVDLSRYSHWCTVKNYLNKVSVSACEQIILRKSHKQMRIAKNIIETKIISKSLKDKLLFILKTNQKMKGKKHLYL